MIGRRLGMLVGAVVATLLLPGCAHEDDRLQAAIETKLPVVAKIGQAKLADGKDRRRSAGCGVGSVGESTDGRRGHTRIGMST